MTLPHKVYYDIDAFAVCDLLNLLGKVLRLIVYGMCCTEDSPRKIGHEVQLLLRRRGRDHYLSVRPWSMSKGGLEFQMRLNGSRSVKSRQLTRS